MKFDLHIHSRRSPDSLSSLDGIVAAAKKRGLSGIAITDHGVFAPEGLDALGRLHGIWTIRGCEVQTEIGDVIGLFLSRQVRGRTAERVISEIHEQGGIAVLAHPFKYTSSYPARILERIDAVETANGRWKDLSQLRNLPKVDALLDRVKGRSAGSDAHFTREVGRAYWETAPLASPAELKQSICSGSGRAVAVRPLPWLDEASQGVKLLKQPSARQLARVLYWSLRRLTFMPRSGL